MRNAKGFSLIELMLTVSFVLLGTMLIQGSFLRAAEMFGRYSHSLQSMVRMDGQIAAGKEELFMTDGGSSGTERGSDAITGKDFEWSRELMPAEGTNLFSLDYRSSWTESGKPVTLHSQQYVYKKDASQNL